MEAMININEIIEDMFKGTSKNRVKLQIIL